MKILLKTYGLPVVKYDGCLIYKEPTGKFIVFGKRYDTIEEAKAVIDTPIKLNLVK